MQHIGDIDGVPVYLCESLVVPAERPDGIELAIRIRAAKTKATAIVMTPAQLQALHAEYAQTAARHERAVARAEALGRPAPEPPAPPAFVPVDDSDLIDEDPVDAGIRGATVEYVSIDVEPVPTGFLDHDLFDDQKFPAEMPADPAADTQPIDTATE